MSATPWNREPTVPTRDTTAALPSPTEPDHSVAHYREALWAARIALLVSIFSAGVAFVGIIMSLISLCFSLR